MGKSKVEIGIPAAFLAHFYEKPAMWWVFWWRCFADLNDGGGQVTYSQPVICSWLGVSRSSLRRIVDFGVKFGGAEQLVDSSWTGGKLTISVLDCGRKQFADSSRTVPAETEAKRPVPARVDGKDRRKSNALFSQMIDAYDVWVRDTTGFPAKIDGAQGKAMKSIIAYLKKAIKTAKTTDGTDEALKSATLKAWDLILANWENMDEFYQNQTKLTQINSNLQVIVTQLRKMRKHPSDKVKDKIDRELQKYLNEQNKDGE